MAEIDQFKIATVDIVSRWQEALFERVNLFTRNFCIDTSRCHVLESVDDYLYESNWNVSGEDLFAVANVLCSTLCKVSDFELRYHFERPLIMESYVFSDVGKITRYPFQDVLIESKWKGGFPERYLCDYYFSALEEFYNDEPEECPRLNPVADFFLYGVEDPGWTEDILEKVKEVKSGGGDWLHLFYAAEFAAYDSKRFGETLKSF